MVSPDNFIRPIAGGPCRKHGKQYCVKCLQLQVQNFMRLSPDTGQLIASSFSGGSYDVLDVKPESVKKADSFYARLLNVLAQNSKAMQTAAQITKTYNEQNSENKTVGTVTKILSRFYTWGFVEYTEKPNDKRGGFWSLKDGIDVNDGQALFNHALQRQNELRGAQKLLNLFSEVAATHDVRG